MPIDVTRMRNGVRLNYGLFDDTTVDLALPVQYVEVPSLGMKETSLGDIEIGVNQRVLGGRTRLWFGATMALPTGESSSVYDDGALAHGSLQIGRGAPDLILSTKCFSTLHPQFSLYGGVMSRWGLGENSSGYQYGTVVDTTLGGVYEAGNFDFYGQFLWEYADTDTRSGSSVGDTGGNVMYFTPGMRYWITESTALSLKTRLLVADDVKGEQMLPQTMVGFGVTMVFGP